MTAITGVGIVGAGNIAGQYLEELNRLPELQVVAIAGRDKTRTSLIADTWGIKECSVSDLLSDDRVSIVLNLTPPQAHAEITLASISAGKHVYTEKPLGCDLAEASRILAAATAAGVRVACAPDTVLGTGIQSACDAVLHEEIGGTFAATAFSGTPGPERWHPNPQFLFARGGGPILDIGPYYLTPLVLLLGPVVSVQARTTQTDRPRTVGSGPLQGTQLNVEVPTHASAILEHRDGAISTVTLSFEVWATTNTRMEIFGSDGTIRIPDANQFSRPVFIQRAGADDWDELPITAGYRDAGRGIGVADLANAIRTGSPHRASGELALHVLDIMTAIGDAKSATESVRLTTSFEPPQVVPLGGWPS